MRSDMRDKLTAAIEALEEGNLPSEVGIMDSQGTAVIPQDEMLSIGEAVAAMVLTDDGEEAIMEILREIGEWIKVADDPEELTEGVALLGRFASGLGDLKTLAEEKIGNLLVEDNPALAEPPEAEAEEPEPTEEGSEQKD